MGSYSLASAPVVSRGWIDEPRGAETLAVMLTGWLDRREREALAYLIEENRLLLRN